MVRSETRARPERKNGHDVRRSSSMEARAESTRAGLPERARTWPARGGRQRGLEKLEEGAQRTSGTKEGFGPTTHRERAAGVAPESWKPKLKCKRVTVLFVRFGRRMRDRPQPLEAAGRMYLVMSSNSFG